MQGKPEKIEFNQEYPCPCRRQAGNLVAITLTEAFGCDRCQQMFIIQNNGYTLEQLAVPYPYKQRWQWQGRRWQPLGNPWRRASLILAWLATFVLIIVCLPNRSGDRLGMVVASAKPTSSLGES